MKLRTLSGIALVLLVTGCAGTDEAGTSTSTTTVPPTTTTAVTTTGATLSDLTGRWENQDLVLEVNSGGEYVIRDPDDGTGALMGGFVARDGDQFSFVTSTTGECPGQTGVYAATLNGTVLTLTIVDDPCAVRSAGFAMPLSLAP